MPQYGVPRLIRLVTSYLLCAVYIQGGLEQGLRLTPSADISIETPAFCGEQVMRGEVTVTAVRYRLVEVRGTRCFGGRSFKIDPRWKRVYPSTLGEPHLLSRGLT